MTSTLNTAEAASFSSLSAFRVSQETGALTFLNQVNCEGRNPVHLALDPAHRHLVVPEAMEAARAGDIARHNRLLEEAAPRLAHCDAVMLAQFSTSVAFGDVQAV